MLDSVTFINADGVTSYILGSATSPLREFEVDPVERVDTERHKMQDHGSWPTYSYLGGMEIHAEGDLFGNGTPDYWTNRRNFLAAIRGPVVGAKPTVRKAGTLQIQVNGEAEAYQTDVTIVSFTPGPIRAGYPDFTEYAITFYSWTPYFWGVTTPANKYWWSQLPDYIDAATIGISATPSAGETSQQVESGVVSSAVTISGGDLPSNTDGGTVSSTVTIVVYEAIDDDNGYTPPGKLPQMPTTDPNTYYLDLGDDPDFITGTFITLWPEDLSFRFPIRDIGTITFQISLSATDFSDNPIISHDFVGPWRNYWRLRYGSITLEAGPVTELGGAAGDDYVTVGGKTWEAYFERWEYPFDPRPTNTRDYAYPNSFQNNELTGSGAPTPAGLVYQAYQRDVILILGDLLSEAMNLPNRMIFNISELSNPIGIVTNHQVIEGDQTKIIEWFNTFADLGDGFDWWITWDRRLKILAPYRFGQTSNPTITYTFDSATPPDSLEWVNTGPGGTHVVGYGAGLSSKLGRAFGYAPGQVQFSRLDESYDFGDVRNVAQLILMTQKKLALGLNPRHEANITLNPDNIPNFWTNFRRGKAIYINYDLEWHLIDSAHRMIAINGNINKEGGATITPELEQIYDLSTNAGTPEG